MVRPERLKGSELHGIRGRAARVVEDRHFIRFIIALIIVNAMTLGLETDDLVVARYGGFLKILDVLVLSIFCIEIALKFIAYRLDFFRRGWNVFDLIVVSIALVPASGPFAVLRALRILRVLRLMSMVRSMRRVITALFHALPGMGSIIAVLLLIYYVAAVLATQIFGKHPAPEMQELFGTIGASMYSLFQLMTLEGWAENIANPTIVYFPWSWSFFIGFIIVTSFAVLNLFIGIIVDAMNFVQEEENRDEKEAFEKALHDDSARLHEDICALRKELAEIKDILRAP